MSIFALIKSKEQFGKIAFRKHKRQLLTKDNTLPLPLVEAHLGSFFFYILFINE